MSRHVIYIPHLGQEDILSQQLAQAFAKHHCSFDKSHGKSKDNSINPTNSTLIVQYGSNLKPLKLVTPTDTLKIMFTPIQNLHAPLHAQTSAAELLNQVPMLIQHILQDGLNPDGCTIQLYTLEHSNQNANIIKQIAKDLLRITNTKNLSIEWHITPKLTSLSPEQLNRIFEPNITCNTIIHAIPLASGEVKLIETKGMYSSSSDVH